MLQFTKRRERLPSLIVFKFGGGSIQWRIMVGIDLLAKWSHLELNQRERIISPLSPPNFFVWIEKVLFRMDINYNKKDHSSTRNLQILQNQAEKEFLLYDKIGRLF